MRRLLLFLAACLFVSLVVAPVAMAQAGLAERGEIYTVERVVDGDTLEVDRLISGEDNVRLIGVDTPETVDPGEPVQPLGPEASDFTTQQLEGQRVALEFDEERVDQFGRPLAYVWASGSELFNETLVSEGWAQVATFEPNVRYEDRFLAAQDRARAQELGIWGLSTEEQCELANLGNGIGEGSPECSGEPNTERPTPEGPEAPPDTPPDDQYEPPADDQYAAPADDQYAAPEDEDAVVPDEGDAGAVQEEEVVPVLPDTGGVSLLTLGAGILLVAGGLLTRRII